MSENMQPGAQDGGESKPTLAQKLGMTVHISPLLKKAERLGLGPRELQILAVQRGCVHYSQGDEPEGELVSRTQFSDHELAIALLSPCMPYDSFGIRCGAAMLSSELNTPREVARLAVIERCVPVVRHVAVAGRNFEPNRPFWPQLLELLPQTPPPKSGVLPHPTRFVAMTGFTRNGPELVVEWQRPRLAGKAAA